MPPYIHPETRKILSRKGVLPPALTLGDLNFVVTDAVNQFLAHYQRTGSALSYSDVNDVIGVLECAKMEFYRRMAIPLENRKLQANGDVYK